MKMRESNLEKHLTDFLFIRAVMLAIIVSASLTYTWIIPTSLCIVRTNHTVGPTYKPTYSM